MRLINLKFNLKYLPNQFFAKYNKMSHTQS